MVIINAIYSSFLHPKLLSVLKYFLPPSQFSYRFLNKCTVFTV